MIHIAREEAEKAGAQEGRVFEVAPRLILRRSDIPALDDLLSPMPERDKSEEYDWGPPVGKEVW